MPFFWFKARRTILELRVGEYAGEGKDARCWSGQGIAEKEGVHCIGRDGGAAAAVAGGEGKLADGNPGGGIDERIVGRNGAPRGDAVELVPRGSSTTKNTRVAEGELAEQPVEAELLEVVL
jgi:hypothetical protein